MKNIIGIATHNTFICNAMEKVIDKTIPEIKTLKYENPIFEINEQKFGEDFKSGRERRRERRLNERKNK